MEVTHNGAVHFEINRDSKKVFVLDSVDNLITFEDWHHLAITYDLIKNKVLLLESTFWEKRKKKTFHEFRIHLNTDLKRSIILSDNDL